MYIDFTEMFAPAIPSEICPLIFFVISLVLLLCPFNILYLSARRWLGIALVGICTFGSAQVVVTCILTFKFT